MKLSYPVILFLIFSCIAYPQKSIRLIITSGFNYTSLEKAENYENFRSLAGIAVNGETEFYLTENVIFSLGLNYSERRYKSVSENYPSTTTYDYSFDYLSFSTRFKYSIPTGIINLFVYGGPNLAFLIKSTYTARTENSNLSSNTEITKDISELYYENELGFIIGNGAAIKIDSAISILLTGEYMFSLTDYIKDNYFEDYFRNLGLQIGVSIKPQ